MFLLLQAAEEAAAAWAMWEAAGGKMGSQDKDSDFDAGKCCMLLAHHSVCST